MESTHILTTASLLSSRIALLALSMPLVFIGCMGVEKDLHMAKQYSSLRDVDQAHWQKLANRKIYFGHQSVGTNVIEGIRDLEQENPLVNLNIRRKDDPSPRSGPAFVESFVGKNGDPQSKAAAFLTAMDEGFGAESDIAMFKFCYADMTRDTDVRRMFAEYKTTVDAIHAKYPALTIVHITMPLTATEGRLKALAKQMLGRPTERDLAVKRNQFNGLLREQYDGKEPIFDLAAVESTQPDGSRVFFENDSTPIYALAPEFTDDGAHLNKLGRRVVAEQFLIALAGL